MRRRCEQSLDANAAAAEQAEDEEKTELDGSSEDEDEDEEQLPETAIIKCQGCKATEDTGGPETAHVRLLLSVDARQVRWTLDHRKVRRPALCVLRMPKGQHPNDESERPNKKVAPETVHRLV